MEDSALRALREQFYAHRSDLIKEFKEYDPNETGMHMIHSIFLDTDGEKEL